MCILPIVSKIYESCIYNQISLKNTVKVLVEKYCEALDKRGYAGILLTDSSKVFDYIYHELLIAKIHAHGFILESLIFIKSYSSDRIQMVKINSSFSDYVNVESGIPQFDWFSDNF